MISYQAELTEKIRAGDREALTELFQRNIHTFKRMVRARIDRRIQSRVDVADVLQDAYIDLVSQLANYAKDPKLPVSLWMRRLIIQRLAKTHRTHIGQELRSVSREVHVEQMVVKATQRMAHRFANHPLTPIGFLIRRENRDQIDDGLKRITESDRQIIFARHVHCRSNKETASCLGFTIHAASKRYTRAVKRLRSVIEEAHPEEVSVLGSSAGRAVRYR